MEGNGTLTLPDEATLYNLTWLRLVRMPVFVDRVEGVAEVVG